MATVVQHPFHGRPTEQIGTREQLNIPAEPFARLEKLKSPLETMPAGEYGTSTSPKAARLAQSAPILPFGLGNPGETRPIVYGVNSPVSAATTPSVYNKKLRNLFRGRLVILPGNYTIANALQRLSQYNITGAPVTVSDKDPTVLGFVDMQDILAYFVKFFGKEYTPGEQFQLTEDDKKNFAAKGDGWKNGYIGNIVNFSQRDPFHIMNGDLTLAEAVDYYLKGGVHRIAITDESNEIVGVISQWTVANYLSTVSTEDKEWIPMLGMPIGNTNLKTENLISCTKNCSVLEAFIKMQAHRLSALAVIDDQGSLCGNISASDLKGFHLYERDANSLFKPVCDFLANVRRLQGRPENYVAEVDNSALILDIFKLMNKEIIHRVYITDNKRKAIGVCSLTDLMKGFVVPTHFYSHIRNPAQTLANSALAQGYPPGFRSAIPEALGSCIYPPRSQ